MADEDNVPNSHEVDGFWWWMSNNWKTVVSVSISLFTFLGGITYFEEIKDRAATVWNLPDDGRHAIAKFDSINEIVISNQLKYEKRISKLEDEMRVMRFVLHNTTVGLSQETDPMQYRGIKFNATNPHYSTGLRAYWIFVEDTTYNLVIPHELKYSVQIDGYEYYDVVNRKKIKLTPH